MRNHRALGALLAGLMLVMGCEDSGTLCLSDLGPAIDASDDPGGEATDLPDDPGTDAQASIDVAVVPENLSLGKVRLGCSASADLCFVNRGPLVEVVLDTKECGPAFQFQSSGPHFLLDVGGQDCARLVFTPQAVGDATCTIRVMAGDPAALLAEVPGTAQGFDGDWRTDTFRQVSGGEIDVLFVVDDSPSMCAHADRLLDAFDAFAADGAVWKNDFHVGVVGMGGDRPGTLHAPTPGGRPWLARGDEPASLGSLADLGCDGSTDDAEAGFDAIRQALSHPAITTTDQPCEADEDCCGGADDCPYVCTDDVCGGPNTGFLRKDAQLEIVVVSDGDDHSEGEVGAFVDFLKSIKGDYNANMMHLNAVVSPGPEPCTIGELAAAEAGARWAEAVAQTGGMQASICADPLWLIDDMGSTSFSLKVQFFLSAAPEPATLTVEVDGATCAAGWRFDAPSNSVIFDHQDPEDPCSTPPEGATIEVRYQPPCLTD